jgi:hypothetical protein
MKQPTLVDLALERREQESASEGLKPMVRTYRGTGEPCEACGEPMKAGATSTKHRKCGGRVRGAALRAAGIADVPRLPSGRAHALVDEKQVVLRYLGASVGNRVKAMRAKADALADKISLYHRQEMALRGAADKLQALLDGEAAEPDAE